MEPPAEYAHIHFPWHRVDEVERGFDAACWMWNGTYSGHFLRCSRRLWREVFNDHPKRSEGRGFNHRCEVFGAKNLCVNPSHVFVGSWSENALKAHELRRAAGVPHMSEEGRARVIASVSRPHAESTKALLSESARRRYKERREEKYDCPECGREFGWAWIKRHRRAAHNVEC